MTKYGYCYTEFSKNCREYKAAATELIKDLDVIPMSDKKTINEKVDLFSDKYLMPSIWGLRLHNGIEMDDLNLLYQKARYHFYFFCDYPFSYYYKKIDSSSYLTNGVFGVYEILKNFKPENVIFPHLSLEYDMKMIKKYSATPITNALIKKYEKALNIYDRIKEVKDNDEEWFKRIQEWDDEEFIIQNIEFRISSYLRSSNKPAKKLLKLYIEYLRPRNSKAMLGVYSRYCRYFLSDVKMKRKFLNEAAKLGVTVSEDKLLDFQEFGSFPEEGVRALKEPLRKRANKKFSSDLVVTQSFAIPNPMLHYLIKNIGFQNLHKLFMTCKYFFIKQPTPICYRLAAVERPHNPQLHGNTIINTHQPQPHFIFDQQALTISDTTPELKQIKNLYVTNYFFSCNPRNRNLLAEILPCIYKFAVKYLTIEYQNIALKDYIFMTESQTVQELNFAYVQIINGNNLAQLEDVMETLPNAYHIDLLQNHGHRFFPSQITINSKTFEKLLEMPRNCKLQHFRFRGCNKTFDPVSCFNFVSSNKVSDEKSRFAFLFRHDIDQDFRRNVLAEFDNLLNEYNGKNERRIGYCVG